MPPQMLTAHLALERVPASLETILKDADEVELGTHYGRMARIDFSIHSVGGDRSGGLLSRAQPILASFASAPRSHFQVGMEEESRLQGSMTGTVRWEQFQKIKSQFPLLKPKLHLSYPELQAIAKL